MPSLVSSVATEEGVADEMTLTVEFGVFGGSPAPVLILALLIMRMQLLIMIICLTFMMVVDLMLHS